MYSYMPELLRTFFDEPVYEELEREITACRQSLEHQLDPTGRKELLRLVDLENERSDRLVFEAFLSGFRLAGGIAAELGQEPPFSFEMAEAQRACQSTGGNPSAF